MRGKKTGVFLTLFSFALNKQQGSILPDSFVTGIGLHHLFLFLWLNLSFWSLITVSAHTRGFCFMILFVWNLEWSSSIHSLNDSLNTSTKALCLVLELFEKGNKREIEIQALVDFIPHTLHFLLYQIILHNKEAFYFLGNELQKQSLRMIFDYIWIIPLLMGLW